jgi:uncharacterized membrane protein YkgB
MDATVNKTTDVGGPIAVYPGFRRPIDVLATVLAKVGRLRDDADYDLLRGAMVTIFFFFGYQKWSPYEVKRPIPFISNGPLIFWLYPALGTRGTTFLPGVSEWTFGVPLFPGFWSMLAGVLGALGSTGTSVATVTTMPFMPAGWNVAAGGFPAMAGDVPCPIMDVVLLAASPYRPKQDVQRSLPGSAMGGPTRS